MIPENTILFGKYRVEARLGGGTFGDVYRVREVGTKAILALKMLRAGASEADLSEAALLRQLNHPNIVSFYSYEVEGDQLGFLMEYMDGGSLADLLRSQGPFPPEKALGFLAAVCRGMAFAHERKIIHRDLKPENILLTKKGDLKVADFGVARALESTQAARSHTGSPSYMAPEVFGAEGYDHRADVYSLGCILYYMLAGNPPFVGSIEQVLRGHLFDAPRIPETWPATVRDLLADCLTKKPAERPKDAGELLHRVGRLTAAAEDPDKTRPVDAPPPLKPPPRPERKPETPFPQAPRPRPDRPPDAGPTANQAARRAEPGRRRKGALAAVVVAGAAALVALIYFAHDLSTRKSSGEAAESASPSAAHEAPRRGTIDRANAPEGMVLIPAGTFWMGCSPGDSECAGDESPRHRVTVDSFYMDIHEVTQGEYQRVMGTNPSHFKNCGSDCPVESVSWDDARAYCAKVGKRLPTEAEWEYAARGGTETAWYCGNGESCLAGIAWYHANSGGTTHPVAKKQANAFGLYDMLGNVWEWVADWYGEDYYASSPGSNPTGPSNGAGRALRVLRGGGWSREPRGVRASYRRYGAPGGRIFSIGFRCSRD